MAECDRPIRRRSTAGDRPAKSGSPQTTQIASVTVETTRRPAARSAPSATFSRLITDSGQAATHAPHPVQLRASTLSRSGPQSPRSARSAPVGQAEPQASQAEQPVASICTTPSEQPAPATRQPARIELRDPSAASALTVASGSRSSTQLPAGDDPADPERRSDGTPGSTDRVSENSSTRATSATKRSSAPARASQSLSSQAITRTSAPAPSSCRSHPADTILVEG